MKLVNTSIIIKHLKRKITHRDMLIKQLKNELKAAKNE